MQGYELQKMLIPSVKWTSNFRDTHTLRQCIGVKINLYNKPMWNIEVRKIGG